MQTSVVLLISAFILLCTGSGRRFSERLSLETGILASLCLLCAAASGFTFAPFAAASLHLGSLLLLACGFLLCRKQAETMISILLAFLCGILGWFLLRQFPQFFEPALLISLPTALLSLLLPTGSRQKLLCVTLSPLFFGLIVTLEDWYLFDALSFSLGNDLQCNAQVIGIALLAVVTDCPNLKRKTRISEGVSARKAFGSDR